MIFTPAALESALAEAQGERNHLATIRDALTKAGLDGLETLEEQHPVRVMIEGIVEMKTDALRARLAEIWRVANISPDAPPDQGDRLLIGLIDSWRADRVCLAKCVEAVGELANELDAGAQTLYQEKAILRTDADWIRAKAQRARNALTPDVLAAAKDLVAMRDAMKAADTALLDWMYLYAPDQCDRKSVETATDRVAKNGGTLAYIARTRAALQAAEERG